MSYLKSIFTSILLVCFSLSASAQMSLQDFVKLPTHRDVQISPDGKHLSMIMSQNGDDLIVILDQATRKPVNAFRVIGSGLGIGKVHWVNDERLIYTVTESFAWDKTRYDTGNLVGVSIDGTRHRYIFGYKAQSDRVGSRIKTKKAARGNHEIIDMLDEDPEHILIAFYQWTHNNTATPLIHKLNVYSGKYRKVDYLPMANASGLTDNENIVRFSTAVNDENKLVVHYKPSRKGDWKEFNLNNFEGRKLYPLSFSKDNNSVYLSANVQNGTRALYRFDLEQGNTEKLFHDPRSNISNYVYDFDGKQIVAVATEYDLPQYQYLDSTNRKAKLHKQLNEAFKGFDIVITSTTKDNKKAIVYAYSDTNPGDYYLFDTQTLAAEYLVTQRPSVKLEDMRPMHPIEITARDGLTLPSYLTLPAKDAKNVPLVVLPHGGPHGVRDYWGFDWEVQLLASQGYAVLQVNFRGSGGFGTEFGTAGHGKWGTSMQDDLTDATLAMIDKGIADKNRICIYGASYGGYAALMGAAKEPDLYRCAIGAMGVYDLPMLFEKGDVPKRESGLAFLKQVIGEDKDDQIARSPAYQAEKIKANIMLVHGEADERAPIEHAYAMMEGLDKAGKSYEWFKLGNEGHGYYDENNRIKVYSKILAFLKQNLN